METHAASCLQVNGDVAQSPGLFAVMTMSIVALMDTPVNLELENALKVYLPFHGSPRKLLSSLKMLRACNVIPHMNAQVATPAAS